MTDVLLPGRPHITPRNVVPTSGRAEPAHLPTAVAVNIATNQVYVVTSTGLISVIDGASNASVTFAGTLGGAAVAVNPITNKIYEAGSGFATIDGVTHQVTVVLTPFAAKTVAVNPATNQIYVAGTSGPANVHAWVVDGATNVVNPLASAPTINLAAVNPVTNRIYLAAVNSPDVTVVDGRKDTPVNVPLLQKGTSAVNAVTNCIYVADPKGDVVNVIDKLTNAVIATVGVGTNPSAIAVNPVTNKIYVLNATSNDVTVIDGLTHYTSRVPIPPIGTAPLLLRAIGINAVTNRIYICSYNSNSVTVIDGATNAASAIYGLNLPLALDINPITNRVYAANSGDGTVAVIDGAANSIVAVANAGTGPNAVAVNLRSNQVYVTNGGSSDVTIIDGASNAATATVPLGASAASVAVDPVTNRVYAGVFGLGVIQSDGTAPYQTTVIPTLGNTPVDLALNPITHKIYAPDFSSATVSVIDGLSSSVVSLQTGAAPAYVSINPVTDRAYVSAQALLTVVSVATEAVPISVTASPTAAGFSLAAASGFGTAVQGAYWQIDDWSGPWTSAEVNPGAPFTALLVNQTPGVHMFSAFATDGQDSTSVNTGTQSAPLTGSIVPALFFVPAPGTPRLLSVAVAAPAGAAIPGTPLQLTALGTYSDGSIENISAQVSWTTSDAAVAIPNESGVVTAGATGMATITASFGSLSASVPVVSGTPVYSVIVAPSGPVTIDGNGNYVVELKLTNTGNVPGVALAFTRALLNSAAASTLPAAIGSLAPGASSTVNVSFPSTAGARGSSAILRVQGGYSGGSLTGPHETFTSGSRITLP